jgi:predicted membrane-bound mannosyltransferase
LGIIVLLALALKGALLAADAVPFNSDEAVVGLMARHILLKGERPVFYYGQAYMGSLDAWLIAGAFALLGISTLTMRLVQVLLFIGLLVSYWLLARRFCRSEEAALVMCALHCPTAGVANSLHHSHVGWLQRGVVAGQSGTPACLRFGRGERVRA